MGTTVGSGWAVERSEVGKVVGVSVKIPEYYCRAATKSFRLRLLGDPCKANCIKQVIRRISFTIELN